MRNLLNSQVSKGAFLFAWSLFAGFNAFAQEESKENDASKLSLSGSIDTYYKYDFSGTPNISTSFGDDQASFSIGMFNLIASQELGKASFVADVGVGPRNAKSAGDGLNASIQNLYIGYQLSEKLSVKAGYMGTFVGYEVIAPTANFNYSTSYLFTNGPFQNAGLRLNYAFSDKVGLMVGVFNDWNKYTDTDGKPDFGAQLFISPTEGWNAYINFITGALSGTEIDLTTTYQINDAFLVGLNAAKYDAIDDAGGFTGAALYLNYALSDKFALGFRGESFTDDKLGILVEGKKSSVTAFTLSANITAGSLKLIPELRLDNAKEGVFMNGSDNASKSASQFLLAAVYAF